MTLHLLASTPSCYSPPELRFALQVPVRDWPEMLRALAHPPLAHYRASLGRGLAPEADPVIGGALGESRGALASWVDDRDCIPDLSTAAWVGLQIDAGTGGPIVGTVTLDASGLTVDLRVDSRHIEADLHDRIRRAVSVLRGE